MKGWWGGLGQAWVRGCGSCPRRVSRPRPLPVPRKMLHLGQARFQGAVCVCARMCKCVHWGVRGADRRVELAVGIKVQGAWVWSLLPEERCPVALCPESGAPSWAGSHPGLPLPPSGTGVCGFGSRKACVSGWGDTGQAPEAQPRPTSLQEAVGHGACLAIVPSSPVLAPPGGPHGEERSLGPGRSGPCGPPPLVPA